MRRGLQIGRAQSAGFDSEACLLLKVLGFVTQVAQRPAIGGLEHAQVAAQDPAQHVGHHQVHGHVAAHLPVQQKLSDLHLCNKLSTVLLVGMHGVALLPLPRAQLP